MQEIKRIDIKQQVLSENDDLANELREKLKRQRVFMVNIMASPGAGKTCLLLETIRRLKDEYRIGVIEGDIESMVDAEKIADAGALAVQIRTGGDCHLDAPMLESAIDTIDLSQVDLLFIENIGNLVCPAEFDTGAMRRVMLLSVPEGDDKILKYPLMFSVCDALLVTKMDYLPLSDFNLPLLQSRVKALNPGMQVLQISSKTGAGMEDWCDWLRAQIQTYFV